MRVAATASTRAVAGILAAHPTDNVVLVGHGTAWTLLVSELTGRPPDLTAWRNLKHARRTHSRALIPPLPPKRVIRSGRAVAIVAEWVARLGISETSQGANNVRELRELNPRHVR